MTSTTIRPDSEIRSRYRELCELLDIPSPPPLQLVNTRKLNSIEVAGVYVPKHRKIVLARKVAFDRVILHELAHHICNEAMGYQGFHGVPFLTLVQLIEDAFFSGEDEITRQVDSAWPRLYSLPSTRRRAIAEAKALVVRANALVDRAAPPTAWKLALMLARAEPAIRLARWRSTRWWLDAVQTQGGNAYQFAGGALLVGLIVPALLAAKLPPPLNIVAGKLSLGCFFAFMVWTVVPICKRLIGWPSGYLSRVLRIFA